MKTVKTVKTMLIVGLIYILTVFGGTSLSMYLDSKFYSNVHAEEVKDNEPQYRVVFVFPDNSRKQTQLVTVYDPVNDVICYTLQNKPYYFKTGLNCFPKWMLENGVN